MKHVVVLSEDEVKNLLSEQSKYLIRFFKKRPNFLKELASDDLIYIKKNKGEIVGQFFIGKLIIIEGIEVGDWNFIKEVGGGKSDLTKEVFEEKIEENELKLSSNKVLIIVQIEKLEQFITSPIDTPKNKKKWLVLE